MPVALSALIILFAAFFAASVSEKALKNVGYKTYAVVAKVAIFIIAGFMILSQLGIAADKLKKLDETMSKDEEETEEKTEE